MRRRSLPNFCLTSAIPLLFLYLSLGRHFLAAAEDSNLRKQCQAESQSCGQCIKRDADCAWCADLHWNGTRCDAKSALSSSGCPPAHIYSPNTEIKLAPQHNLPLASRRADGITVVQLEPQQVEVRMKPGDVVEVPFRYLHKLPVSGYEVKDFTIQTSEFRSLGLDIDFSIDCNGERITGRVCPGVKPDQKISFYAKVSLKDCKNPNLIAVSIGIYGYNTVSAIFVTPLCGCDCENPRNQEKRSPRCGYQGNLVCGKCQCDQGKGGEKCECDLNKYGVSNADALMEKCQEHKTAPVCSGRGHCSCGRCECQADYIRGRYCECDNGNCPMNYEGKMCSGRGSCECGKCVCERGWTGDDCGCSDDQAPCAENGVVCSNNGYCECGKCSCNVGWTGATCNVQQPLPEGPSSTIGPSSTAASEEFEEEGELLPEGDVAAQQQEQFDGQTTAMPVPGGSALGTHAMNWAIKALGTLLAFFLGLALL